MESEKITALSKPPKCSLYYFSIIHVHFTTLHKQAIDTHFPLTKLLAK
jgi:hypothetical protein